MKNLDEIKGRLIDLSEIINKFKSEAVQLKIVEFVLDLEPEASQKPIDSNPQRKTPRRKATKKKVDETARKKSGKKPVGQGAVATLEKLVEEGFFSEAKSINDIVQHCERNLARKFKTNEFSGKLGRLVRNETLTRNKNSDNQYEYTKK